MSEAVGGVRAAPRVAVVGGGMAGLGAARVLEKARLAGSSLDWLLIESEPRLGGKVHTVRREGFVIEGGPDSAIIEKPWPIEAARELGIARPAAGLQRGHPQELRLLAAGAYMSCPRASS